MSRRYITIVLLLITLNGCSRRDTTLQQGPAQPATEQPSGPPQPPVDACTLLTSEEIQSVQGEAVQEARPSLQTAGGLAVSQCYFTLPTHSNSVVVNVTQSAEGKPAEVRKLWDAAFASAAQGPEDPEQGENAPPRKIPGLGEQAFWTGTASGGALNILHRDRQIRISVGGPGDINAKLDKAETLAELILQRL